MKSEIRAHLFDIVQTVYFSAINAGYLYSCVL